ncbi:MAG: AAA family ATPase [Eubacterium sp.]|nr:AAA family ATPase [Eubacterium sp.]
MADSLLGTESAESSSVNSDKSSLQEVSMTELYDRVYEPKAPVVEGLLYPGTYIFAGSPKVGKSFFMAQLAYHVAAGIPLWEYQVRQGSVLYLALEDDYARLQKRLSRMFDVEGTDSLFFATDARSMAEGLEAQMEQFITKHSDTVLIIIDTLQRIRELGSEQYSYSKDYEVIKSLKSFADKHGICFLIVHHTRKMEAEDSFDMISGTNGLLGAADGAFVLKKEIESGLSRMLMIRFDIEHLTGKEAIELVNR